MKVKSVDVRKCVQKKIVYFAVQTDKVTTVFFNALIDYSNTHETGNS